MKARLPLPPIDDDHDATEVDAFGGPGHSPRRPPWEGTLRLGAGGHGVIGSYQIDRVLGEGGMAVVYLGHHRLIDRAAAIKVLNGAYVRRPGQLDRFLDEARVMATLRHPNLVEVLECDLLRDGRPYLAMEYVRGESLAELLGDGQALAERDALAVVRGTALALAVAHARGIVHRDIKPANLIVPEGAGFDAVKVLDFGVAKLPRADGDPRSTRHDVMVGTPYYMAPEQCLAARDAEPRSDLYSLGCVLFEMLALRPPFDGDTATAVLASHLHGAVPDLRAALPQVHPETARLIAALLAKDPDARVQTAMEVVARVDQIVQALGAPLPAAVVTTWSAHANSHLDAVVAWMRRGLGGVRIGVATALFVATLAVLVAFGLGLAARELAGPPAAIPHERAPAAPDAGVSEPDVIDQSQGDVS